MFGKIQITGTLEIVTGIHIGGSSAFAAIGAVDSPVIRDAGTNLPMIPGSSLKGKLRTLLARQYNQGIPTDPNEDAECIIRLFGSAKKVHGVIPRGRLLFTDMILNNREELYAKGIQGLTEVKFENSINRLTAVANPRQIERVIRGAKFGLDLIYEVTEEEGVADDFKVLAEGLQLLQYDYLGGNGSRGYGKVKFSDLEASAVVGDIDESLIDQCNEILACGR
ncbi:MAG: type III-A CRISPR-associated RAMP protein Csm3 [Lachnospiraceae bacterium]|nr:type III-A CRISPR-associated RAMP protein Csm3 [Lachnospiraceae bacterium]